MTQISHQSLEFVPPIVPEILTYEVKTLNPLFYPLYWTICIKFQPMIDFIKFHSCYNFYKFWLTPLQVISIFPKNFYFHTGYTLITKYVQIGAKCEKRKVYSGVFHATFFEFRSISHQGRHLRENSKDFVVYYFVALMKHEICLKWEKCITSVLHFVVCFAKTSRIYPRNAKYEKCIAGLMEIKPLK